MSQLLFVYGTLRRAHPHAMADFLRSQATWVASGRLSGYLYDVGTYPAAVLGAEDGAYVYGDLFLMKNPDAVFEVLDPYEGLDEGLYCRQLCPIRTSAGQWEEAWVYLFSESVAALTPIPSGDYLAYIDR